MRLLPLLLALALPTHVWAAARFAIILGSNKGSAQHSRLWFAERDADGDGKVTLAEAFHYTSSRTITGTSITQVGAQHPTYNFRMSGRGDVVLSDLRRAEATLQLPGDAAISYVVSNRRGLVAESPGGLVLALPAGRYQVERHQGKEHARADGVLARGEAGTPGTFAPFVPSVGRAKGGEVPVELFAGVNLATAALAGESFLPGVRLGVRREVGPLALRLRVDYAPGAGDDNGLRYALHRFGVAVAGLYPLYDRGLRIEGGLEAGYTFNLERLESTRTYQASEGLGALTAAVTYPLGPVALAAQVSGGVRFFPLNGVPPVGPRLDGARKQHV